MLHALKAGLSNSVFKEEEEVSSKEDNPRGTEAHRDLWRYGERCFGLAIHWTHVQFEDL